MQNQLQNSLPASLHYNIDGLNGAACAHCASTAVWAQAILTECCVAAVLGHLHIAPQYPRQLAADI